MHDRYIIVVSALMHNILTTCAKCQYKKRKSTVEDIISFLQWFTIIFKFNSRLAWRMIAFNLECKHQMRYMFISAILSLNYYSNVSTDRFIY